MSGLTFLFFKQRLLDAIIIIYKSTYFKVGLQSGLVAELLGNSAVYFTIKSP